MTSVANHYSSELVSFVRRVMEAIPMLVFDNLKAIMGLQTRMRVSPPLPSLPLHALTVGAPCSLL